MDVLGLDHADLTVTDIARSAAFYDRALGELGFRRVPSSPELDVFATLLGILLASTLAEAGVVTRVTSAGLESL